MADAALHGHGFEATEERDATADGPPVVEEQLERTPHRDPADDDQALAQDLAQRALGEVGRELRESDERRQHDEPDHQRELRTAEVLGLEPDFDAWLAEDAVDPEMI